MLLLSERFLDHNSHLCECEPCEWSQSKAHPLVFTCTLPHADSVKEETRSASPHCPKPDESEEPLGTAMETEAAEGQSQRIPLHSPQGSRRSLLA